MILSLLALAKLQIFLDLLPFPPHFLGVGNFSKKLACMDMEERYRLIISSILNAIGFRVDVERMMVNGRIDIIASSNIYM